MLSKGLAVLYGWYLPHTLQRRCLAACDVRRGLLAVDHSTARRRAGGGQLLKARCQRHDDRHGTCIGVALLAYRHKPLETLVHLVVAVGLLVQAVRIDALDFMRRSETCRR
jgi:hypothetical protein